MEGCFPKLWAAQNPLNRFVRWSKNGVFDRIFAALAAEKADSSQQSLMIDATHLKAHRTAASPRKKGHLLVAWGEQKAD